MKRTTIFIYGLISYFIFFLTFLYMIGWVGNLLVPSAIDGAVQMPFNKAFMIDAGLIVLFALQHSIMARKGFKSAIKKVIPEAAERSTYVLASSIALIAMFYFWQPLGGVIWSVTDSVGQGILYSISGFGWLLVLLATFLINHFDLFGLRQIWLNLRNQPYTKLKFGVPFLYKMVRHPLYLGFMLAFWATPSMTMTHLVFAALMTGYIFIAIRYEERDLIADHGQDYVQYQKRVAMIIPGLGKSKTTVPVGSEAQL